MLSEMTYKDRTDAGKLLGFHIRSNLGKFDPKEIVVLGLARGGIVIAYEVAKELGCRFDVMVVKKIGHPENPEYAAAAVSQDEIFLNPDVKILTQYIEDEAKHKRVEIAQKLTLYHNRRPAIELKNKTVILVDDGIATGLSMRAAIAQVRSQKPMEVMVAVPVGAPDSIQEISADAQKVFCLYSPLFFAAVGQFYRDFPQLTDDEVVSFLQKPIP